LLRVVLEEVQTILVVEVLVDLELEQTYLLLLAPLIR
jgi:hypothetical protein